MRHETKNYVSSSSSDNNFRVSVRRPHTQEWRKLIGTVLMFDCVPSLAAADSSLKLSEISTAVVCTSNFQPFSKINHWICDDFFPSFSACVRRRSKERFSDEKRDKFFFYFFCCVVFCSFVFVHSRVGQANDIMSSSSTVPALLCNLQLPLLLLEMKSEVFPIIPSPPSHPSSRRRRWAMVETFKGNIKRKWGKAASDSSFSLSINNLDMSGRQLFHKRERTKLFRCQINYIELEQRKSNYCLIACSDSLFGCFSTFQLPLMGFTTQNLDHNSNSDGSTQKISSLMA